MTFRYICRPGSIEDLVTGERRSSQNSWIEAAELAPPGSQIGVMGRLPSGSIGDARLGSAHDATTKAGIHDLVFVGLDHEAALGSVTIWQDPDFGWNHDLTWEDLTLFGSRGKGACFFTTMHNDRLHAGLLLERCRLAPRKNSNGVPTYWGVQGDGWVQVSMIECEGEGFFEHFAYIHNGGGDMKFLGNRVRRCLRTAFQVAGRHVKNLGHAQPPTGLIEIQGNHISDCSSYVAGSTGLSWGNGSAITVSGHMDPVRIINNHIDTRGNVGSDELPGGGGGIVLWHDSKLGEWADEQGGYSIPKAVVKGNKIDCPRAQRSGRDVVMIGGVRESLVGHNLLEGRDAAGLQMNHRAKNGRNWLTGPDRPSDWRGWGEDLQGRVRLGQNKPPHFLTSAEIDFYWRSGGED